MAIARCPNSGQYCNMVPVSGYVPAFGRNIEPGQNPEYMNECTIPSETNPSPSALSYCGFYAITRTALEGGQK